MRLYVYFILLLFIPFQGFTQKNCSFTTMDDSTICTPGAVELSINGSNLDQIKWFGPNVLSSDTVKSITVQIDSTTTYYVTNRIPDPNNLIVNGDFEAGNTGFQSDYTESCIPGKMPQGSYCINTRTDIYWPAWKPCTDHTSGTGNVYVTDGAIRPDEKIWCQTVATEQHTDYEFSAWLTTVLNQENAILQFTINTTPIGDPFEASPVECEWNEFFQIWNSGANTSAEICITNQNSASEGNDFALDDIRFNKVCYSEDSVTITVHEEIEVTINKDTTVCPGDEFTVQPTQNYPSHYKYLWSTGETSQSIVYDDIGTIDLEVYTDAGCFNSDTMQINRIENPTSTLIKDTALCFAIFGELDLQPGSANKIVWEHPSGIDSSLNFKATEPGNYKVTLYNGDNCFITDRVNIEDFCATELFIPNSFTPNNDGINDTFGAIAVAAYSFELLIYNRWGNLIFETKDLNSVWTGEDAPTGTYSYFLTYEIADREGGYLKEIKKIGNINLIR